MNWRKQLKLNSLHFNERQTTEFIQLNIFKTIIIIVAVAKLVTQLYIYWQDASFNQMTYLIHDVIEDNGIEILINFP